MMWPQDDKSYVRAVITTMVFAVFGFLMFIGVIVFGVMMLIKHLRWV